MDTFWVGYAGGTAIGLVACVCLNLDAWRMRRRAKDEKLRYETASTLLGMTPLTISGTGSSPVTLASGDTLSLLFPNGSTINIMSTNSTTLSVVTKLS